MNAREKTAFEVASQSLFQIIRYLKNDLRMNKKEIEMLVGAGIQKLVIEELHELDKSRRQDPNPLV